jgi:hypothetical protein
MCTVASGTRRFGSELKDSGVVKCDCRGIRKGVGVEMLEAPIKYRMRRYMVSRLGRQFDVLERMSHLEEELRRRVGVSANRPRVVCSTAASDEQRQQLDNE